MKRNEVNAHKTMTTFFIRNDINKSQCNWISARSVLAVTKSIEIKLKNKGGKCIVDLRRSWYTQNRSHCVSALTHLLRQTKTCAFGKSLMISKPNISLQLIHCSWIRLRLTGPTQRFGSIFVYDLALMCHCDVCTLIPPTSCELGRKRSQRSQQPSIQ